MPANDIIKLASNENPLGPSRLAVAALRKSLGQLNLYPDGNSFYLKQKLAAKLAVEPQNLILGSGSNEVIELIGHSLLSPEAEVVLDLVAQVVAVSVRQVGAGPRARGIRS